MKFYLEFYHYGVDYYNTGKIPICAMSDYIIPLENYLSRTSVHFKAKQFASESIKSEEIMGYKILKGDDILSAEAITDLIRF